MACFALLRPGQLCLMRLLVVAERRPVGMLVQPMQCMLLRVSVLQHACISYMAWSHTACMINQATSTGSCAVTYSRVLRVQALCKLLVWV
jgi:hypothetical protein